MSYLPQIKFSIEPFSDISSTLRFQPFCIDSQLGSAFPHPTFRIGNRFLNNPNMPLQYDSEAVHADD
jgi:hypothetical protein